jgi:two-component sensor histidine kinase
VSARMRVLVIDDTPDDRQLVRHELESLFPDADIIELAGRAETEAALAAGPADLVVTDLSLRWGSGREVFERVKELMPACPVIMFTGSGDEMTAVDLLKAGLDDYVVKSPRQLSRLRASLRVVVDASRSRTALSKRELQLTQALAHKDIVVRELHHRVKNNLQSMASLLKLRAKRSGGALATHLEELSGQMRALAAVQLRTYKSEQFDRVDFAAVLDDLMESLSANYANGQVTLVRDFEGTLDLESDRATSLSLLCYEIILNALKHAWPDRRKGRLVVALWTQGKRAGISVSDDGVGFEGTDVVKGLGTRLIRALAREAQAEIVTVSRLGEGCTVTLHLV